MEIEITISEMEANHKEINVLKLNRPDNPYLEILN